MTSHTKKEVISYKLYRANEALAETTFLIENDLLTTAVNRLYYGCFYAVSALLYNKEIVVKTHSGAIQMFGLHFVSTGVISRESGKFFSDIFELRQDSDYEDFIEFERHEVTELVPFARNLVKEIEQILSKP